MCLSVCVVYPQGVSDMAPTDDLGHDGGSGTFYHRGVTTETRGSEVEVSARTVYVFACQS